MSWIGVRMNRLLERIDRDDLLWMFGGAAVVGFVAFIVALLKNDLEWWTAVLVAAVIVGHLAARVIEEWMKARPPEPPHGG